MSDTAILSPREIDVLQCAADDLTIEGTARRLGISLHTVHIHRSSALARLGVSSMTAAVYRACGLGLLTPRAVPVAAPDRVGDMRRRDTRARDALWYAEACNGVRAGAIAARMGMHHVTIREGVRRYADREHLPYPWQRRRKTAS